MRACAGDVGPHTGRCGCERVTDGRMCLVDLTKESLYWVGDDMHSIPNLCGPAGLGIALETLRGRRPFAEPRERSRERLGECRLMVCGAHAPRRICQIRTSQIRPLHGFAVEFLAASNRAVAGTTSVAAFEERRMG